MLTEKNSEEELLQEGIRAEDYETDSGYLDAVQTHFPEAGTPIEFPNQFQYTLQINSIVADVNEQEEIGVSNELGEETKVWKNKKKHYEGEWKFKLAIGIEESNHEIIPVNETNKSGIGISKVEKSKYEISAGQILPKDADEADYITVICDAEGNKLDAQGDNAEVFSTFGRDTSKVSVDVCDYLQ